MGCRIGDDGREVLVLIEGNRPWCRASEGLAPLEPPRPRVRQAADIPQPKAKRGRRPIFEPITPAAKRPARLPGPCVICGGDPGRNRVCLGCLGAGPIA
ncbi:hypothetical protein OJF2_24940 [Aquisphaera giovannonii]|uniref:Uncharacterized protein n=1 Tax=Aquisphaera giovannonii TaxID=406548 RepID=A0A5B9W185_9BACT|nr:hypothetical protein OJF2_24940 [Aquisphaera giovannonii]